ncbi:hypothetical protein KBD81_00330 [Candidatus Woesebacteria bacterium]|nr:hypothetical protein [Candidatus Woesebacteria bacterium]
MIIAIDLDEILADTTSAVIRYHNDTFGTSYRIADFHSNEWWKVWGGTREQSVQKFFDFANTPYFHQVEPVIGAREAVSELTKNHTLHIVTSRQIVLEVQTKKWVDTNFPGIFQGIHLTNHAQWALSGKTQTKHEVCIEHGAELLIEDSLLYAQECCDAIPVLLLDYPWNQGTLPPNTTRVYSWEEIVKRVDLSV